MTGSNWIRIDAKPNFSKGTHMWAQKTLQLKARSRGFHLVTDEIEQQLPQIQSLSVGLLHLFIQHTSASLTLNENADPTVRMDMEAHFNKFVPERAP